MSMAVVLAGGRSSRMPFDKQTIRIDGKRMAVAIADKIAPLFDRVLIVSNAPDYYRDCGYDAVPDQVESCGPISGFYTGLTAAAADPDDYVYFVACDMPFIEPDYIRYMRTLLDGEADVVSVIRDGHIETFNAFYHKRLLGFLEELFQRKQYSLLRIFDSRKIRFIEEEVMKRYDRVGKMFVNINCYRDYERYLKHD